MQAWSTKQAQPTSTIELRANVCCVKYNPNTAHEIAVGSADHNVHLYDLRKASSPVHVFGGKHCAQLRALNMPLLEPTSLDLQSTKALPAGRFSLVYNGAWRRKLHYGCLRLLYSSLGPAHLALQLCSEELQVWKQVQSCIWLNGPQGRWCGLWLHLARVKMPSAKHLHMEVWNDIKTWDHSRDRGCGSVSFSTTPAVAS